MTKLHQIPKCWLFLLWSGLRRCTFYSEFFLNWCGLAFYLDLPFLETRILIWVGINEKVSSVECVQCQTCLPTKNFFFMMFVLGQSILASRIHQPRRSSCQQYYPNRCPLSLSCGGSWSQYKIWEGGNCPSSTGLGINVQQAFGNVWKLVEF